MKIAAFFILLSLSLSPLHSSVEMSCKKPQPGLQGVTGPQGPVGPPGPPGPEGPTGPTGPALVPVFLNAYSTTGSAETGLFFPLDQVSADSGAGVELSSNGITISTSGFYQINYGVYPFLAPDQSATILVRNVNAGFPDILSTLINATNNGDDFNVVPLTGSTIIPIDTIDGPARLLIANVSEDTLNSDADPNTLFAYLQVVKVGDLP